MSKIIFEIEGKQYKTKQIPNYPFYFVSECGEIISNKRNKPIVMKQGTNGGFGYKYAILTNHTGSKTYRVHRIVAHAFIDNPDLHRVVHHIDGNRKNNSVDNLMWCSYTFNNVDAIKKGTRKCVGGVKKPVQQICLETSRVLNEYPSVSAAARAMECDTSAIRWVATGQMKSCRGYGWKFV